MRLTMYNHTTNRRGVPDRATYMSGLSVYIGSSRIELFLIVRVVVNVCRIVYASRIQRQSVS